LTATGGFLGNGGLGLPEITEFLKINEQSLIFISDTEHLLKLQCRCEIPQLHNSNEEKMAKSQIYLHKYY
jgi:hypothetical protein